MKSLAWTNNVRCWSSDNLTRYSIPTLSGTPYSVELEKTKNSLKVTVSSRLVELACNEYSNVFYNIVHHTWVAIVKHEREVVAMRKAALNYVVHGESRSRLFPSRDPKFIGCVRAHPLTGKYYKLLRVYEIEELCNDHDIAKSFAFVAKHSVGDEVY